MRRMSLDLMQGLLALVGAYPDRLGRMGAGPVNLMLRSLYNSGLFLFQSRGPGLGFGIDVFFCWVVRSIQRQSSWQLFPQSESVSYARFDFLSKSSSLPFPPPSPPLFSPLRSSETRSVPQPH